MLPCEVLARIVARELAADELKARLQAVKAPARLETPRSHEPCVCGLAHAARVPWISVMALAATQTCLQARFLEVIGPILPEVRLTFAQLSSSLPLSIVQQAEEPQEGERESEMGG